LSIFYTPLTSTASSIYLGLVYIYSRPKSSYDRVTRGKRRIPTYNVTPTLTRPSRWRAVRSTTPILTAAPTYVYSRIPSSKNRSFKNFLGPFRGPPGLDARIFRLLFSRHLPRDFFPPLHLKLNRGFYSGTPNLQRYPTPTPYSDPPPRDTYLRIFHGLSTSILTLAFTQALPLPAPPLHQFHVRIPLLALRTLRFSPASLPRF